MDQILIYRSMSYYHKWISRAHTTVGIQVANAYQNCLTAAVHGLHFSLSSEVIIRVQSNVTVLHDRTNELVKSRALSLHLV